ncbi:MAG: (2Fe-2S) ferredoxin domain-containing protein [Gemmataceae bacterium]
MDDRQRQEEAAVKLGIGRLRRHVLLCVGEACCTAEAGMAAWEALKGQIKEAGLTECFRTKVGCLRVCAGGPVAVVYPDGVWYGGITADRVPRLVREHLAEGRPVEEWAFARNPLPAAGEVSDAGGRG